MGWCICRYHLHESLQEDAGPRRVGSYWTPQSVGESSETAASLMLEYCPLASVAERLGELEEGGSTPP